MPKRTITYTQDLTDTSEASVSNSNKRAKLSNDEKLSKFNISKTNYDSWSAELSKLGYSQDQSDRVILRKYSANTVKSLIINHQLLINSGFNNANLISVSSHNGGSKNLEALKLLLQNQFQWNKFTEAGFTVDNFVKITSHHGGSKNLEALISLVQNHELWDKLTEAGFTIDNFVKITSHDGGSKNLEALKLLMQNQFQWNKLTEAGFTIDNFVKITSHDGGSKNLEALISVVQNHELWNKLTEASFTIDNFVKIISNIGGSKNLEALISLVQNQDPWNKLIEAGFTVDNFVKITSNIGGSKKLVELISSWELKEFIAYFNLDSNETLNDLEVHDSYRGDSVVEQTKADTQEIYGNMILQLEDFVHKCDELINNPIQITPDNLMEHQETLNDIVCHYSSQSHSDELKTDIEAPDESADLVFQSDNSIKTWDELINNINDLMGEIY